MGKAPKQPRRKAVARVKKSAKKMGPQEVYKRGPWSPQEDRWLLSLVGNRGPQNWVHVSSQLATRSAKQCRERYHQNLKPTLDHSPISQEEGAHIERLVAQMGKRWAEIARQLTGRSDNAVKNWWNGGMNRRKRMGERRGSNFRNGANAGKGRQPQQPVSATIPSATVGMANLQSPYTSNLNPAPRPRLPPVNTGAHRRNNSAQYLAKVRGSRPSMVLDATTRIEQPLISPMSDVNPPSLVDDNGSQFTPSPQLAQPPVLRSPVVRREEHRRSFPTGFSPTDSMHMVTMQRTLPAPKFDFHQPPMQSSSSLYHLAEMATSATRHPNHPVALPPNRAAIEVDRHARIVATQARLDVPHKNREIREQNSQCYVSDKVEASKAADRKDSRMNMNYLMSSN